MSAGRSEASSKAPSQPTPAAARELVSAFMADPETVAALRQELDDMERREPVPDDFNRLRNVLRLP